MEFLSVAVLLFINQSFFRSVVTGLNKKFNKFKFNFLKNCIPTIY